MRVWPSPCMWALGLCVHSCPRVAEPACTGRAVGKSVVKSLYVGTGAVCAFASKSVDAPVGTCDRSASLGASRCVCGQSGPCVCVCDRDMLHVAGTEESAGAPAVTSRAPSPSHPPLAPAPSWQPPCLQTLSLPLRALLGHQPGARLQLRAGSCVTLSQAPEPCPGPLL